MAHRDTAPPRRARTARVAEIEAPHTRKVVAVLEDMLSRAKAGRLPSMMFIAEEIGRSQPYYGIVGRFRADPARAIGQLAIMQEKVKDYAADLAPEIDEE